MIDIESIFRHKKPNQEKLVNNGFELSEHCYRKSFDIMQNQFNIIVTIANTGTVSYKVYETDTNEEYALVHVQNAHGDFVGTIRDACEKVLIDISDKCFNVEVYKAKQSRRVLHYIKDTYDIEAEFLWEKSSDSAAFRRKDNHKWFAIMMIIDKSKLGCSDHGNIEIIDLKDSPENVENYLDKDNYLKAYHMNKKHWYTICLDESIKDEELFSLIDKSYQCIK
ncbi:MAG: MmcQ/YjbR family DNA-binding protein [Coprobacillus sp.]